MQKNIHAIKQFWDNNPLYAGEFEPEVETKDWFDQMFRVKLKDCFCGDLRKWVPKNCEGKKVLDVGCGPGFWFRPFNDSGADYHAIDISPRTVELAQKHRDLYGLKVDIQIGNAEQIPFPDNHFDYVISEGVIHHTPDTQACVNEIYRILKPGGSAAIGVYYKSFFLHYSWIFRLVLKAMKIFNIGLKGRGRDRLSQAITPEEFVRMYDGEHNPIGKAYTIPALRRMFSRFSEVKFSRYFFPVRAFHVSIPCALHKLLQFFFGFMVLVRVTKPKKKN